MAKVRDHKRLGNTATTTPVGQQDRHAAKARQKPGARPTTSHKAKALAVRALAAVKGKMKQSTLATVDREVAETQVDRALYHGEYLAPEPYQTETGLTILKTMAYHAYMVASTVADVPEKNMDLLRRLMSEADQITQRRARDRQIAQPVASSTTRADLPHSKAKEIPKAPANDQPPGARERSTLLVIIAALARSADVDISGSWKAAERIEALTNTLGARVSARTIFNKLKEIPDALERAGNDGQTEE
jgi:hypothetical protein